MVFGELNSGIRAGKANTVLTELYIVSASFFFFVHQTDGKLDLAPAQVKEPISWIIGDPPWQEL